MQGIMKYRTRTETLRSCRRSAPAAVGMTQAPQPPLLRCGASAEGALGPLPCHSLILGPLGQLTAALFSKLSSSHSQE